MLKKLSIQHSAQAKVRVAKVRVHTNLITVVLCEIQQCNVLLKSLSDWKESLT